MINGRRARADQYARRVNAAAKLLAFGLGVAQAARRLAHRDQLSERQARRYVERALKSGGMDIPGPKKVFTVRLPTELIRRLRNYAKASSWSLSSLVIRALEEFLDRMRAGPRGGR